MLNQEYSYYLFKLFMAGLPSLPGVICILLLVVAGYVLLRLRSPRRLMIFWSCLLVSIAAGSLSFYSAVYEFEENPAMLIEAGAPANDEACGTAWTAWAKAGYGMANPCPKDCYRGLTLRKELRMSGFPPWPVYRRELQCLRND